MTVLHLLRLRGTLSSPVTFITPHIPIITVLLMYWVDRGTLRLGNHHKQCRTGPYVLHIFHVWEAACIRAVGALHDCGGAWLAMAEAGAGYGWYLAASWPQATTVFKVTGRRTRETGGNPANGETKKTNWTNTSGALLVWDAWTPQGGTSSSSKSDTQTQLTALYLIGAPMWSGERESRSYLWFSSLAEQWLPNCSLCCAHRAFLLRLRDPRQANALSLTMLCYAMPPSKAMFGLSLGLRAAASARSLLNSGRLSYFRLRVQFILFSWSVPLGVLLALLLPYSLPPHVLI